MAENKVKKDIFECPHCKTRLNVSKIPDGKKGKCPSCKNVIIIKRSKAKDLIVDRILQTSILKIEERMKEIKDNLRGFVKDEFSIIHSRIDDLMTKSSNKIDSSISNSESKINEFLQTAREDLPKIESLLKNNVDQYLNQNQKELDHFITSLRKEISAATAAFEERFTEISKELNNQSFTAVKKIDKSIKENQKQVKELKESLLSDTIKFKETIDNHFNKLQSSLKNKFSEQSNIIKETFEEFTDKTYTQLDNKLQDYISNLSQEISYEFGIPQEGILDFSSDENLPILETPSSSSDDNIREDDTSSDNAQDEAVVEEEPDNGPDGFVSEDELVTHTSSKNKEQ